MRSELNSKKIDASVGGLVWVRRRNGSWWPGRIMGSDELSESCLVSPRSGTPVKLLGREDASVDWYNLEKSKRVKAFRCGEYDECIEKAKASAAHSNKKAVKYARREDAILHALDLENALKPNEQHEFRSRTDNSSGTKNDTWVRGPQSMFDPGKEHECMTGRASLFEGNSIQELSQSGISFEDQNHIITPKVHSMLKKKRKTPYDSEDDGTEGTKRMRGLEDLGMVVASKIKAKMRFHTEGLHELVQQDTVSLSKPNMGNGLSNRSPVNGSKGSCSSLNRRRSQVVSVHENLKRKNRRRPLTKVLESTAMVSVPVLCDQGASPGQSSLQGVTDSKVSALESTESKKTNVSMVINSNSDCTGASCEKETSLNGSEHTFDAGVDATHFHSEMKDSEFCSMSDFPENDCSDSLFDVPFVGEEKQTGGFSPVFAPFASRRVQPTVGSISLSDEELDETGSTCLTVHVNNFSQRIDKGTSKWQLKGKRNLRSLSKKTSKSQDSRRSMNRDDQSDDYLPVGFGRKVDINTFDESLASDNCTQLAKSRLISEDLGDVSQHWGNRTSHIETQTAAANYLDSIRCGRRSLGNREVVIQSAERRDSQFNSLMHEKSLVAKSTTPVKNKEVYLMSGGPVSPPMPQRSVSHRQSRFTTYSSYQIGDAPRRNITGGSSLFDVNLEVRASYRGQRVPLVSLMSKLNGKAIVGHPLTVEVLDDGNCDLLMSCIDCCPTSSNDVLYDVPTENMSDRSMDITSSSLLLGGGDNAVGTLQAETGFAVQSHLEAQRIPVKQSTVHSSFSPKKSPKIRKCGLSSKKTRRLSSFTAHEQKKEDRKPVVEKLGESAIACVPLKVVFSRINEAVNCSAQSAHH